ncbi:hypothetical protein HWV62_22596 [Athelia sp. TMB]|nr:hypothetical protein HWV62_22596 [Athelia sp. TMB]
MEKLNVVIDAWADVSREMVLAARKVIDDALCMKAEECFEMPEWLELMESDGARFEDEEQVGLVMDAVKRGLSEQSAGMVYQVLVSSILLRPHITERDSTMLSSTSRIREQVEAVRMEVLKWLRKRWVGVRQEGGFNDLEGWAIKEISGEIEVPVEDLINNSPTSPARGVPTRSGLRPTLSKVDPDTDSVSLRASVLSRNTMKRSTTPSQRDLDRQSFHSSASSVRSVARSEASSTATYTTTKLPPNEINTNTLKDPRPDSKLTPTESNSVRSSVAGSLSPSVTPSRKTLVTKVTPRISSTSSRSPSMASNASRPKSIAPSVASSIRSPRSKTPPSPRHSLRPPPAGVASRPTSSRPVSSRPPRPTSSLSTTSDGSTTFKSAQSEFTATSPTRRTSVASNLSNSSNKTQGPSTGKITLTRPRVPSAASSVNSTTSKAKKPSPASSLAPSESASRKSPSPVAVRRPPSMASVKSTVSSINATPTKKTVARKVAEKKSASVLSTSTRNGRASPASTVKGKSKAATIVEEEIPLGKASMESSSTVRALKEKKSTDTIKTATPLIGIPMAVDKPLPSPMMEEPPSPQVHLTPPLSDEMHEMAPRGATLEIGIPCIISSKRKRFRAYARYIGEVEGEFGPWVGVEVPVGESWVGEQLEGRQWHDGSWGGVRYFDIGAAGSEWDDGDNDRAIRRRKLDIMNGSSRNLKREGDQLSLDRSKRFRSASPAISDVSMSESRGLFVRPQQVLYVVDAVGAL